VTRRRSVVSSAVAAGFMLAAAVAGLLVGAVPLDPASVLGASLGRLPLIGGDGGLDATEQVILFELRLPRVVLALVVGSMLALAGGAYQGVFRNPLADPYLLGIAAGAGLAATIVIAYGPPEAATSLLLPAAAFAGASASVLVTYLVGRSGGRGAAGLILAGVTVAAFLTAIQTFVQQRKAESIRDVYGWLLGQLETSGWSDVLMVLPYAAVAAVLMLAHRRLLDVLRVGEEEAATLGVNVARLRLVVIGAATIGTAAAVAVSGLIGFVGIIVPHAIRLLAGGGYRLLMPLCLLAGGGFLVLADVVARAALAPAELPIGVVTAFFGAPFFAIVLRTSRLVTP
jgi:iron complex transport system permease protein